MTWVLNALITSMMCFVQSLLTVSKMYVTICDREKLLTILLYRHIHDYYFKTVCFAS